MTWKAKTITEIKMQFAFPSVFFFEFRAPLGICAHGNAFGNLEQLNGKTFTLDCNVIRTDVFLNGWNIHPPGERTKPNPTRCGRHKLTYRGNKNETSKAASAFDWDQDAANLAAPLWHPENIFQKSFATYIGTTRHLL